jgi:arylsulfatase A-like enzyme
MAARFSKVPPDVRASSNRPAFWRWAAWLAVVGGLVQALLVILTHEYTGRIVLQSADVVWTAPIANGVWFLLVAFALQASKSRMERATQAWIASATLLGLFLIGPILLIPGLHVVAAIVLTAGMAVSCARAVIAHARAFDAIVRRSLPALIAASATAGVGLHVAGGVIAQRVEGAAPTPQPDSPNVLLIVVDTVRATNLSLYGYQRRTSPRLEELAAHAVVFDRALSTAPWTLPSHASLFTGRYPHDLGADWLTRLDHRHPTLAETFAQEGYATAGFVANFLATAAGTGLNRGFREYRDAPISAATVLTSSWLSRALLQFYRGISGDLSPIAHKSAAQVNAEFLAWLSSHRTRPFFVFLNYFDAHAPFSAPQPFDSRFGRGGPAPDFQDREGWTRDDVSKMLDAYDGAIAYLDDQLGNLIDALEGLGILDDTIVVVTSDHGEQFGEHNLLYHGNSLYRPLLHVPLLIRYPRRVPSGIRVADSVSLVDVAATLTDLAGVRSGGRLPGRSLSAIWSMPQKDRSGSPILSEVSRSINEPEWLPVSRGPMKSIIADGLHYIRNGDGQEELYDFEHDTEEQVDLSAQPRTQDRLAALRRMLETIVKEDRHPAAANAR